jgi:hypothetical protein
MTIRRIGWIFFLLLTIAALYGQFLSSPIIFDDLPFFMVDAQSRQPIDNYHYAPFELRSLPYATLAWSKAVFGLDMRHFRIENLLLHAAVTISLFYFLTRLLEAVCRERADSVLSARALAFCGALLFALHPVATYAAGYLVQRTILMATLFSLLAMLAWVHGSLKQNNFWLWGSVPLFYLAVFAKEHAIMLPGVLFVLTVLLHEDWRAKLKQRWPIFVVLALIVLFVMAARRGVIGSVYEIYAPEMLEATSNLNHPLSALTQSWLFFKYIGLWLLPNPRWMSIDMREPFAQSLWSFYTLAFAVFIAWGVAGAWLILRRGRFALLGFAMLFPWLMFLPELSVVRIQESFVLYRSYLWAVGACCLLPLLLDHLEKRMAVIVVSAIVLAMFPISMDRLASFSHPLVLWNDAEKLVENRRDLPGTYRIYYNRGTELLKADYYDGAVDDLKLSVELKPDWPYSYNNLGSAYLKKSEWRLAADAFTQAIEIANEKKMGTNPRTHYGRAIAYQELGEHAKSQEDFGITCKLDRMGCDKLDGVSKAAKVR